VDLATVELQAAGVRPLGAGDNLHQGAFARSVLTHDGMDASSLDVKADVLQRAHARVTLGNSSYFQDRGHGTFFETVSRYIKPLISAISSGPRGGSPE
jgi:hypothetical protein